MPAPQHRICRLADEAAATRDPELSLSKLRELRDELVAFERSRVSQALRSGSSFSSVAKALGISRQAAHRRYRELAPGTAQPLALSTHARRAIQLARKEAAATGARGVTSAHLLLGVLKSGAAVSRALEAVGLTAATARDCLGTGDAATGEDGDGGVARAVLAEAAEIARARHTTYVEPDHIALAALNGTDGDALQAITALGVSPADVRERLAC